VSVLKRLPSHSPLLSFVRYDTRVYLEITILIVQVLVILAAVPWILSRLARRISAYTDAPLIVTQYKTLGMIFEALAIQPGDVVYELGCGDGRFLFYCAKRCPEAHYVGIESNFLLVWYIRAKKFCLRAHNVSVRQSDIAEEDFSQATKIYFYLLPEFIQKISDKFPHARTVSRAYPIPGRNPVSTLAPSKDPGTWNEQRWYLYEL